MQIRRLLFLSSPPPPLASQVSNALEIKDKTLNLPKKALQKSGSYLLKSPFQPYCLSFSYWTAL